MCFCIPSHTSLIRDTERRARQRGADLENGNKRKQSEQTQTSANICKQTPTIPSLVFFFYTLFHDPPFLAFLDFLAFFLSRFSLLFGIAFCFLLKGCWGYPCGKESIHRPAPVQNFSVQKKMGSTEERFRWWIWLSWFL